VIDTSTVATDTIAYVATDQNGLTATTTRTVIVDPAPDSGESPTGVIIQAANDNQASSTPANDDSPPAASSAVSTSTAQ
jgi:hypothetical protein